MCSFRKVVIGDMTFILKFIGKYKILLVKFMEVEYLFC